MDRRSEATKRAWRRRVAGLCAVALLAGATISPAAALTPQQILEAMFPKAKKPVHHHVRPRRAAPAVEARKAPPAVERVPSATGGPVEAQKAPEPPAGEPATPDSYAPDNPAHGMPLPLRRPDVAAAAQAFPPAAVDAPAEASAMPLPQKNPLRQAAAMMAVSPVKPMSLAVPDGAAPVVDVPVRRHLAAQAARAREAVSKMAGEPMSKPNFDALAFAPPMIAIPPVADQVAVAPAPLPRGKPPVTLAALSPAAVPAPVRPAPALDAAACQSALASLKISATARPPVAAGTCGAADPYDVGALDGGAVTLQPKAIINCEMASSLARWLDEKVQPAAMQKLGSRVTALQVADSYSCRSRDSIPGAQLSEHAFMNAVDISAFQVDGKWIPVEKPKDRTEAQQAFLDQARAGACDEFRTVLGPGSDSYHSSHFHLDMRHRGRHGDAKYCH